MRVFDWRGRLKLIEVAFHISLQATSGYEWSVLPETIISIFGKHNVSIYCGNALYLLQLISAQL